MHIKNVQYSRVFSLGNYENEKIGVEVEVQKNEDPQKALEEAKKFVDLSSKTFKQKLETAKEILKHRDDHTGRVVKEAESFVKEYDSITQKILPNNPDSKE